VRTLESKFADCLEFLAGKPPLLAQLPDGRTDGLPLSLKERYRFLGVTLFDLDWILAMELPDVEICSPREYAGHVGMLESKLRGKRVILVMSAMPSSSRNRLIQDGLPKKRTFKKIDGKNEPV